MLRFDFFFVHWSTENSTLRIKDREIANSHTIFSAQSRISYASVDQKYNKLHERQSGFLAINRHSFSINQNQDNNNCLKLCDSVTKRNDLLLYALVARKATVRVSV